MWQARHVQARLQSLYPACQVEILGMTTEGDRVLDRPLAQVGGKGLFIKELESALLDGRADLAVHSLKDVPIDLPDPFELVAVLEREDPRDAFVCGQWADLDEMPAQARVGTSSVRRAAQIRARYPHLRVVGVRGNVNTRLAKLDRGEADALVLAAAGLKRLGLAQRIRSILPVSISLPAPGQGVLGIEIRRGAPNLREWLAPLTHHATLWQVSAERAAAAMLGGSCTVPFGAFAEYLPDAEAGEVRLTLEALLASPDGQRILKAHASASVTQTQQALALGQAVGRSLKDQGADALLAPS